MTESYSTPREVKHQEYLLEKSLQELNIKEAQSERREAVRRLSMGPFIFEPQYNNLRVFMTDNGALTYVLLTNRARMISKETFLTEMTRALMECMQQDFSERVEVNRSYASLILQLIKDSDVYDRIIEAYEHYYVALKALDEVEKNLQAWDEEMKKLEDDASDTFHIQLDICNT